MRHISPKSIMNRNRLQRETGMATGPFIKRYYALPFDVREETYQKMKAAFMGKKASKTSKSKSKSKKSKSKSQSKSKKSDSRKRSKTKSRRRRSVRKTSRKSRKH